METNLLLRQVGVALQITPLLHKVLLLSSKYFKGYLVKMCDSFISALSTIAYLEVALVSPSHRVVTGNTCGDMRQPF